LILDLHAELAEVLHDDNNPFATSGAEGGVTIAADLERADGDIQFVHPDTLSGATPLLCGSSCTFCRSLAPPRMSVATCHNHPVTTASHPFGLILLIHHICICLLFTLAARNLEKASVPLAQLKLFSSPQRQPPMVLTKYTT
jgi:hypothetical protein